MQEKFLAKAFCPTNKDMHFYQNIQKGFGQSVDRYFIQNGVFLNMT
jgi:hypothetical protein